MGKSHGKIYIPNVRRADEAGILHGFGKPVALRAVGRGAAVLRYILAEVLAADGFVACPPLGAAEIAALVAEELHLVLFRLRERSEPVKPPVQAKIRHDIRKLLPLEFLPKVPKIRQHLGRRGHKIQLGIPPPEIVEQQLRMDDDAVSRRFALIEKRAETGALVIREMLLPQEGIAEREPRRNAVFAQQREHLARIIVPVPGASAVPEAVRRRAVDRADVAPVVKPFPVLIKQRQKHTVKFVKLKKSRQMVVRRRLYPLVHFLPFPSFSFYHSRSTFPSGHRDTAERSFYARHKKSRRGPARSAAAWLGRPDLNRRLAESKSAALPLGYTPIQNYKIKAQIKAQQSGFDLERKKESA